MDASAIKAIADLAVTAERAQALNDTDIPGFLVGSQLIVTEHLLAQRKRFRGTFATSVLADFAAYLIANKNDNVRGFVSPENRTAVAFLNIGTTLAPGHCDWRAILDLTKTAGYAAVCALQQQRFTQRELAEWCEDWAAFLTAPGEQTLAQAVAAIRNVTVTTNASATHTDAQFSASKTALEEVAANSQASTLPASLTFTVEPHVGFQARPFGLRVNLIASKDDKPQFSLRVIGREVLEESIADEFKTKLSDAVGDAAQFLIGNFKP